MGQPAYNLILDTAGTKYISGSFNVKRFVDGMETLEAGLIAGVIWNVEFQDAKYHVAQGTEHAQHIASEVSRETNRRSLPSGDPRYDIGYAFGMNQAAPLAKRLRKLPASEITSGLAHYIAVLDQIAAINGWLKNFKDIIKKGRRPVIKDAAQVERDFFNTGTCAICGRTQKLDELNMVHHGYEMSDYNHAGYRIGKCFGTGYKPYELSNEANVAFAPVLAGHKADIVGSLKRLQSGTITEVEVTRTKWENHNSIEYKVTLTILDNPTEFQQEIAARIARKESELRMVISDIKTNDARIKSWTLQPLKYGSK